MKNLKKKVILMSFDTEWCRLCPSLIEMRLDNVALGHLAGGIGVNP